MALDEELTFSASSKVWIFFLASTIITAATFGISALWDHWRRGTSDGHENTNGDTSQGGTVAEDRRLLEPAGDLDPDIDEQLANLREYMTGKPPGACDASTSSVMDQ